MARILITGGKGTLGRSLTTELRKRGHEVWTCGRSHDADPQHIRADVSEARQIQDLFEELKPHFCYHFAAEFGRKNGQQYYEQLWKTNCLGTRNVIDSCHEFGTHLIFASSSEAYGTLGNHFILTEELLEEKAPKFHNEYALSKWTNEKQIELAQTKGLMATILRFFNVYGPDEEYTPYRSVIALFCYRMIHGEDVEVFDQSSRSFLHINDWTKAVANVVDYDTTGMTFNIGSPTEYKLSEVAQLVKKAVGNTKSRITYCGLESSNVSTKMPDIACASECLKLSDSITLKNGIKQTVKWMKERYV